MTQIAADWEDRLRLSAPFVEQRLQFDGYERRISTPRTQRGDHRCRHESPERSEARPRRKDLRKLACAGTDCPRSSGRAVPNAFGIHYRGHLVGTLIPDILVDEKVIVDPKVVQAFTDDHIAQMLVYLAISELELALLLNFKFAKLSWKRVVRSRSADEP